MKKNSRILLPYMILVIIVMVGLGIVLGQLTKGYIVSLFEERMENESSIILAYLEEYAKNEEIDETDLEAFSRDVEMGLIFFNEKDELIINTTQALGSISEEQSLVEAHAEGRLNQTNEGKWEGHIFYYPIPVDIDGLSGTLVIVSPVDSILNISKNIWLLIGIMLVFLLVTVLVIGNNIFEKYIKPIRSASDAASELAKGNYRARTYDGYFGDAGELSNSINVLARNLQTMSMEQGMQEQRLEAVINNMGSGLILIDEKGYIHLVNRAFLDSFGGNSKDYVGSLYYDAIKHEAIHEAVQDIFMLEETVRETFVLPINIERRHLEVTGAPIFTASRKWKGVVLVFHDITEMKHLEEMRKDFVANVSHELKTPITSIRGFSETLLDGAMKDEALLQQFLHIILKESGRLQSLINDLLELSKLEKSNFQLNVTEFNLQDLLKDIVPIVQHAADQKQIELDMSIDGETVVEGDAPRLKQVFVNLMLNAVNYTAEGGKVNVSLSEERENVIILVRDTGIGIPQEEIPRIFERFYRVDRARSRNSGGTGLGLAIVKHIIEAHRGKVEVESEIGKGTTFKVILHKSFTQS
ncbi:two-component system histidine kinase PnpS [Thalassobacillus hwangdonensis]|uniref:histidine kinase n=1 Tax=Thalassobacillus hwangdonensis TaxID=546108 RepID=A0ABW3KZ97_9BACI